MRKTFLTLCAGILIGVFAGSATGAFAAIGDRVEAVFAKYNFVINGEQVELNADPLLHEGRTYLPVRALLNALGYEVDYIAESRTITADKDADALIEEVNKVLGKGDEIVMDPEIPSISIEEQLSTIDAKIHSVENRLRLYEALKDDPGISDESKKGFGLTEEEAAKLEAELTDLLQQKVDLESQLQAAE